MCRAAIWPGEGQVLSLRRIFWEYQMDLGQQLERLHSSKDEMELWGSWLLTRPLKRS